MKFQTNIFLYVLFCIYGNILFSQDTLSVKELLSESRIQYRIDKDSSIFLATQALKESTKINFANGKAQAKNIIGLIYRQRMELDSSLYYFDFCNDEEVALKYRCNCYLIRGNIIRDLANYWKADSLYQLGITIANELQDTGKLSSFYNSLAITYDYKQDFEQSIHYHLKSGEMSLLLNDSTGFAISLQNIGILYRQMREPQKAIMHYDSALVYANNNHERVSRINHLKGVAFMEMEEYKKAANLFAAVIESGHDKYELQAVTHLDLALTHKEMGQFSQALKTCTTGLQFAKSDRRLFRLYITQAEILLGLNFCNRARESITQAEKYMATEREYEAIASFYQIKLLTSTCQKSKAMSTSMDSFITYMDKMYFDKKEFEAKQLGIKYETEKKELQNQILQSENQQKQSYIQRMWLWGSLILSLLLSGLGFFWFRNKVLSKDKELIQISMDQLHESNKSLSDQLQQLREIQEKSDHHKDLPISTEGLLSDDLELIIPNKPENITVSLNKVVYVKSAKNYIDIFVEGRNRPITYRATLKGFISEWLPEEVFIRIHKGHVVNKNYITDYDKKEVELDLNGEKRILIVGNTFGENLLERMS